MKWEVTPQGYRVAKAVITRAGAFNYRGRDLGLTGQQANQPTTLYRTIQDLSHPKTLQSFEGLPLTITHPSNSKVIADDWRGKSIGHIQNVRAEGDLIVCDAYIQDKSAIDLLNDLSELRELSVGYEEDPTIEEVDGKLYHKNITGNHVAIVVDGRAGRCCRILTDSKENGMTLKEKIIAKLKGRKPLVDAEGVTLTDEEVSQIIDALEADDDGQGKFDEIIALLKKEDEPTPPTDDDTPPAPPSDDVEALKAENAQLKAENEALKTENEQLKAQLDELTNANETTSAMNDAKAYFPKLKIGEAKSAREVYAKVLIDSAVFSQEKVKGLTDAEVKAAFIAYQASNSKKTNIGKVLLSDAKADSKPAQKRLGGK